MFVADLSYLGNELRRRDDRATFALDCLDDHSRRFPHTGMGILEHMVQILGAFHATLVGRLIKRTSITVGIRNKVHFRREWKKRFTKMASAGDRESSGCHAVIRAFKSNDGLPLGVELRQFDRGLNRIGAGGSSEGNSIQ